MINPTEQKESQLPQRQQDDDTTESTPVVESTQNDANKVDVSDSTEDTTGSLNVALDPNARIEEIDFDFNNLAISNGLKKAIAEFGFKQMTEVQARSIPVLLSGSDVLGAAKTGSGKTLAFLIPAIEMLVNNDHKMRNGTGALIISPTRELCLQTYSVVERLCRYHSKITRGVIMGGTNRGAEASNLRRGIMLLVATPARLLDHMQTTHNFKYDELLTLVIDEADRILEIGFEETLRDIIKLLPEKRQTVFFSATQTKNVQDIARISVRSPVYIGVQQNEKTSTDDEIQLENFV